MGRLSKHKKTKKGDRFGKTEYDHEPDQPHMNKKVTTKSVEKIPFKLRQIMNLKDKVSGKQPKAVESPLKTKKQNQYPKEKEVNWDEDDEVVEAKKPTAPTQPKDKEKKEDDNEWMKIREGESLKQHDRRIRTQLHHQLQDMRTTEMKVQSSSARAKAYNKEKRKRKQEKAEDKEMHRVLDAAETKTDLVQFGEVVQAPPRLVMPKKKLYAKGEARSHPQIMLPMDQVPEGSEDDGADEEDEVVPQPKKAKATNSKSTPEEMEQMRQQVQDAYKRLKQKKRDDKQRAIELQPLQQPNLNKKHKVAGTRKDRLRMKKKERREERPDLTKTEYAPEEKLWDFDESEFVFATREETDQ
eukprot:TRINITY_DN4234_c0_g1_i1.p1 TRINITY_DN4234_c0_g1~~TRINITY_DN4234_c0_g1_i1.p1  ORF type:complete len:371 (-),score=93.77 TRINITY_DN4234_c0_g1_i1:620-1684(-)